MTLFNQSYNDISQMIFIWCSSSCERLLLQFLDRYFERVCSGHQGRLCQIENLHFESC